MNTFHADIVAGAELPTRIFQIDRALLVQYANASGDQNPIHQNEEFAISVGLPNVIAHGMLTMALVGKYVSDLAGGSAAVKEFSARFTKPVVVPANAVVDLVVSAKVLQNEAGLVKLELFAVVDDVKVLGMAKAVISTS